MPKVLERGEVRTKHISLIASELYREATRLGIDASKLSAEILEDPSERYSFRDTAYLRCDSRAWGIGVTIDIRLAPDAETALGYHAECELSWSSTGRSLSQAVHAVSYYQRAIELAACIEGLVR